MLPANNTTLKNAPCFDKKHQIMACVQLNVTPEVYIAIKHVKKMFDVHKDVPKLNAELKRSFIFFMLKTA